MSSKLVLTFLAVPVLSACSDMGFPPEGRIDCVASTTALDFGQVEVGSSVDGSFRLRNRGWTVMEGTFTCDSEEFTILGTAEYVIQPGDSLQVVVRFAPTTQGFKSGTVTAGSACSEVLCTGEGARATAGASCTVSPSDLDFGQVELGSFDDRTIIITNEGAISFSGDVSSLCPDFAVVAGGGPFLLSPSESLVVGVRFAPTFVGPSACTVSTGIDCGAVQAAGEGVAPASTVAFTTDIQPIFDASCATTGCHRTPNPQGGLSLMSGQSYGQLVNVTAQGYAPALRVLPGDPGESVLYNKVANTGRFGGGMPPSGGIGPTGIDLIRTWILEGAPEN